MAAHELSAQHARRYGLGGVRSDDHPGNSGEVGNEAQLQQGGALGAQRARYGAGLVVGSHHRVAPSMSSTVAIIVRRRKLVEEGGDDTEAGLTRRRYRKPASMRRDQIANVLLVGGAGGVHLVAYALLCPSRPVLPRAVNPLCYKHMAAWLYLTFDFHSNESNRIESNRIIGC